MFDIGGLELLVVAVILIVVVGPKELPAMLRVFGRTMAKVRGMAAEFRGQFDDALREAELDEVRKAVSDVGNLNPKKAMRDAVSPFREAGEGLKRDLDVGPPMEAPVKAGANADTTSGGGRGATPAPAVAPDMGADVGAAPAAGGDAKPSVTPAVTPAAKPAVAPAAGSATRDPKVTETAGEDR